MSAAPATRPSTPAPMSETARLINTFIAPSKTFTDLKRVRRWWVPWLLITVISYALVAVVAQKIGFQQVTENQLKLSKRAEQLEKLPPDRRARQMAVAVTFTKAISYAIPAVNLLFFLVIAAVLMATLNFGAGAEIPFGTALAVVTYAYLPGLVRGLLAVIAVLAGLNPETFNFQNPVATNLGYFMDPAASPTLYRLASSLDVVTLWVLVLIGIGFACVSKLKRSTTLAVVFGWYALVVLAGVAFGALFS